MTLSLKCHPDFLADAITAIDVDIFYDGLGHLTLDYVVSGEISALILLEQTTAKRTDYLWQQTCFEAFVGIVGEKNYLEVNLSPSTEWAVYAFEDHRRGMSNPRLQADPQIQISQNIDQYRLKAELDLRVLPEVGGESLEVAITAVINEQNGRNSLWALEHPSGNPDFHNRDCFVHRLEGATAA